MIEVLKRIKRFLFPSYLSSKTNDRINYPRCTFLGDTMSQSFSSLFMWEKVLGSLKFSRLIELGTSSGTLSGYFYLFCLNKGAEFYTFDIKKEYVKTQVKDFLNLDEVFKSHDVLNDPGFISELIKREGRTVLFCDNGNKPKEFAIYATYLKAGDIICLHDWLQEYKYNDVKGVIKDNELKMVYEDICKSFYSHIRIFQKV